nr:YolD-like family protein [Alicyclobacillus sendaiensis]
MKRKRPVLTEERLEEMQYTLSEAIREGRAVRMTVFTPERDVVLVGHATGRGRELRVRTAAGVHTVDVRDVVEVEIVSGDSM